MGVFLVGWVGEMMMMRRKVVVAKVGHGGGGCFVNLGCQRVCVLLGSGPNNPVKTREGGVRGGRRAKRRRDITDL